MSLHTDRQAFMAEIADRVKKARETIDVEKTVEALQACVAGTKILDKEQIAAAKILLGKVMPDLKAVELTGENGGAIKIQRIERTIVENATSSDSQGI